MGRNRFEDQIKDTLAKRELTPSAGSWEKLSGKLNAEKKKPAPLFWWIGIAATILGAIFIGGLVYNKNPEINSPILVETPVENSSNTEFSQQPLEVLKNGNEAIADETKNLKKAVSGEKINQRGSQKNESKTIQIAENNNAAISTEEILQTQVASVESENSLPEKQELTQVSQLENDPEIISEMNIVLAEIAQMEKTNGKVGEAEVDALLARAAIQISKNRQEIYSSEKIDAGALLWDVEMEMENSFREKVFEVMKEGFLKARTAVANRNN